MTPTPRRQRACLARRAIPANGATVRSRLARRTPLPGMSIVPSEAGALRRPSARRPSRRSPRVVWWDSTGSSRSHGRSMRCVPVPRHEKLSRASRLSRIAPAKDHPSFSVADSRVFSSPHTASSQGEGPQGDRGVAPQGQARRRVRPHREEVQRPRGLPRQPPRRRALLRRPAQQRRVHQKIRPRRRLIHWNSSQVRPQQPGFTLRFADPYGPMGRVVRVHDRAKAIARATRCQHARQ